MSLITVRQILDPYVDDFQYVAWGEVTLETNGDLCLSKIGFGMPGDHFFIVSRQEGQNELFVSPIDRVPAYFIEGMISYEGTSPILTVIESCDANSADERIRAGIRAMIREERDAYWKGLLTDAWNWVALPFSPMPSNPVKSISQHRDTIPIPPEVQQPAFSGSVSTGVSNKANTFGLVHRRQAAEMSCVIET